MEAISREQDQLLSDMAPPVANASSQTDPDHAGLLVEMCVAECIGDDEEYEQAQLVDRGFQNMVLADLDRSQIETNTWIRPVSVTSSQNAVIERYHRPKSVTSMHDIGVSPLPWARELAKIQRLDSIGSDGSHSSKCARLKK